MFSLILRMCLKLLHSLKKGFDVLIGTGMHDSLALLVMYASHLYLLRLPCLQNITSVSG